MRPTSRLIAVDRRLAEVALLIATCLATMGCGGQGPLTHPVSGSITFEGAPISEGDIFLKAADGRGRSYAGKINDGQFALQSTVGTKRVEIFARRAIPGKFISMNGFKEPLLEMYIPRAYNVTSELSVVVASTKPNEFQWKLSRVSATPPSK